jgi:hypothetical protein
VADVVERIARDERQRITLGRIQHRDVGRQDNPDIGHLVAEIAARGVHFDRIADFDVA